MWVGCISNGDRNYENLSEGRFGGLWVGAERSNELCVTAFKLTDAAVIRLGREGASDSGGIVGFQVDGCFSRSQSEEPRLPLDAAGLDIRPAGARSVMLDVNTGAGQFVANVEAAGDARDPKVYGAVGFSMFRAGQGTVNDDAGRGFVLCVTDARGGGGGFVMGIAVSRFVDIDRRLGRTTHKQHQ